MWSREMGGALKNVIAIAAGLAEGLGSVTTRWRSDHARLAEISRLACAAGAKRETLAGLTVLGDLVLTCTGHISRNRNVGFELGRGRPLSDVLGACAWLRRVRTTEAALAWRRATASSCRCGAGGRGHGDARIPGGAREPHAAPQRES